MPTSVIEQIRRVVCDGAGLRDGELLGRFVDRHDEAALAALVCRHGPMVWGVCRRLLGHHDAEDAFQATFIVLVRKAASIAHGEAVGNWLYGVAHRTALQARRSGARRREVRVADVPEPEAAQDQRPEPQPLLDQELSRLPDRYRAVIVLSDLEGKTRAEVADLLGCPEGTVASRLARARAMLAKRLTKRGVALPGGALAAMLSQNAASGAVPTSAVASTIKAANLGLAAVPVKVASLAEGVLNSMLLTKLKNAAVVVALVAAATGAAAWQASTGGPSTSRRADAPSSAVTGALSAQKPKADPASPTKDGEEAAPAVDPTKLGADAELAARDADNRWESALTLRRLGLAAHNFQSEHGRLPDDIADAKGKPLLSWRVAVLPHLGQKALYDEFRLGEPWDSEHNVKLLDRMPEAFRSPRVKLKGKGNTVYQVFRGPDAPFGRAAPLRLQAVADGTSNTILAVEATAAVPWTKPADVRFDRKRALPDFGKAFGKRPVAVLMDGSYRVLDLGKISEATLKNAIDPLDGNALGADWKAGTSLPRPRQPRE